MNLLPGTPIPERALCAKGSDGACNLSRFGMGLQLGNTRGTSVSLRESDPVAETLEPAS